MSKIIIRLFPGEHNHGRLIVQMTFITSTSSLNIGALVHNDPSILLQSFICKERPNAISCEKERICWDGTLIFEV